MDNVNTILRIAGAVPQRKGNAIVTFTWLALPLPIPERLFIRAQMKRLSPQCASAIQIVRPAESIAEMPAQTPSGFAEIVSDNFPVTFHSQSTFTAALFR
jgi:hypothetical protein